MMTIFKYYCNVCLTFVVKMLCYTGGGLSCSCKHSALALALDLGINANGLDTNGLINITGFKESH